MPQIQQEVWIDASPSRVYRALTDSSDFAAFTGDPARIAAQEGGAFSCFGDLVLGRNIELVPDQRVVQAWRVFNWPEGVYSIVRFELQAEGENTRLVLTQDGVPDTDVGHVESGWHSKYWEPLRKHLE